MLLVTSELMRRLDEETTNRFEPGLVLMERAGQGIFEAIMEFAGEPEDECASIFLGSGNNAGDGLVVARLLAGKGMKVILHYMHEPEKLSPDAFKNYKRLEGMRGDGVIEEIFPGMADWKQKSSAALEESTFVVDALLGTGINSPVRSDYGAVIGAINGSGLPVVAVDIPSGINGTTAEVMGSAVRADLTVTMALPKTGSVFYPGKAFCGSLEVVDIGIPGEIMNGSGIDDHILDVYMAIEDLPERSPDSHKFGCGSLLVVAGSRRYSGAAWLSAMAALRTGCGIVYLAGPESIRTVIQSAAPEIVFISLPETGAGSIAAIAAKTLMDQARFDAMAIGPGLTTDPETARFVEEILELCGVPMVIDADALNAFEGRFDVVARLSAGKQAIVTPHSGELARLTGERIPASPAGRIGALRALAAGAGLTLVHKGAPTVIAHPSGRIDVNVFGHPGQATAGSGDVLTGAIAGILAQSRDSAAAARLGVYLHSRAAEFAAGDTGERGMTAGDCCDALPLALKELEEGAGFC